MSDGHSAISDQGYTHDCVISYALIKLFLKNNRALSHCKIEDLCTPDQKGNKGKKKRPLISTTLRGGEKNEENKLGNITASGRSTA